MADVRGSGVMQRTPADKAVSMGSSSGPSQPSASAAGGAPDTKSSFVAAHLKIAESFAAVQERDATLLVPDWFNTGQ